MADDDIFREVEEQMRQERLNALWKRYAPYAAGVAILILSAVMGNQFYQQHVYETSAQDGDALIAVFDLLNNQNEDSEKHEQASAALASLAQEGSGGYPLLAKFRLASLEEGKADRKENAIALYNEIIQEASLPEFKSIALIRRAYLEMGEKSYADLQGDLAELNGNWVLLREEILGAKAFSEDDFKLASMHYFQIINGANAPNFLRSRASEVMNLLAEKGITPAQ